MNKQKNKLDVRVKCLSEKEAKKLYDFLEFYMWEYTKNPLNRMNMISRYGREVAITFGDEIIIPKNAYTFEAKTKINVKSKSKLKGGKIKWNKK